MTDISTALPAASLPEPTSCPPDDKPTTLRQIVYVSQARTDLTSRQLAAILNTARTNNDHNKISGMLVFNSGQFMQCIEGPWSEVEALMSGIKKDRRHEYMAILLDQAITDRDFDCWLMGFKDLSLNKAFAENDDVIDADFLGHLAHPSRAVALLASFAKL
ncbi:Acylphosphatase-like domain-containing protein [Fimicolochytrium jonesii]|uniref:Acylphosphatase-like domain-containing protein n=1 Tax=Fimicolochytrium jonesii TaxID=1396493 RepID=UPI0022FEAB54|nr:Acylphosphatase-like domain-containing protein [Fimicolochytrium jonesii]KAI8823732.1 Acylphosphatase-like domain-containing protein [Fimicolochytrium jonesii]